MQISMPYRKIQRPTTLVLAPPGTFPVNPRKKYKHLHIKLGKNHAYTQKNNQSNQWLWQVSFHSRLYASYKLRFTLLSFI